MKMLCKLFGHKLPLRGWWGDGLYSRPHGGNHDGMNESHFYLQHECPRCGEHYVAARFHGSEVTRKLDENDLKKALADKGPRP